PYLTRLPLLTILVHSFLTVPLLPLPPVFPYTTLFRSRNIVLFAAEGIIHSLKSIFNKSAKGCKRPLGPTLFGPKRICIYPRTLRSANVRYATDKTIGKKIANVLMRAQTSG